MTDSAEPPPGAVNFRPADPWRDMSADERDIISPDDEAERERWMRDNTPPHHL
ncbi:hypothetical protein [Mycobacterium deserti]|uniref:Antitoxin n=1 Tax=Mycobacterium deserti TaxID=2978347 RepID=A0ABT2M556_9MYCO|nr:hypothetical protein [Mycobacterium deserti]MCT7657388.1 hypothetical protein [Mycobacterium deserti]